jgi:hypothetical protein
MSVIVPFTKQLRAGRDATKQFKKFKQFTKQLRAGGDGRGSAPAACKHGGATTPRSRAGPGCALCTHAYADGPASVMGMEKNSL